MGGVKAEARFSVCITSIMRVLAYKPNQLQDNTYSGVGSMTWSIGEQGISIVCACLPTCRPLLGCFYLSPRRNRCSGGSRSTKKEKFRSGGRPSDAQNVLARVVRVDATVRVW